MPCAAILLALLLIIHDPALPQGRWGRGAGVRTPSMTSAGAGTTSSSHAGSPLSAGHGRLRFSATPPAFFQADAADTTPRPRAKKSSWTAIGLSAILPGAGQVYTENYWKVPIIWGLGGYWVYEWTKNNDRYKEFRDLYTGSIAAFPPNGDERYLRLREFYKDQRDSFTWYMGILYLINIADAYVGAELYDFDVGPDLGAAGGGGMHASLRIRF